MNTEALLSAGVPAEHHDLFTKEKLIELNPIYRNGTDPFTPSVIGMIVKGEVGAIKKAWKIILTKGVPSEENFAKWEAEEVAQKVLWDKVHAEQAIKIGQYVPAKYVHLFTHQSLRELAKEHSVDFGSHAGRYACAGNKWAIEKVWVVLLSIGAVEGALL